MSEPLRSRAPPRERAEDLISGKNIFVIGLDDFHRARLATVTGAEGFTFHGVLSSEEVADAPQYDIPALLDRAEQRIRSFGCSIDAVVGYYDLPVTMMLPILCRRLGIPTPSLESVLRCEHKYWSRVEQREVAADALPPFRLVDPFAEDAASGIDLDFPYWLKPVKSLGSYLGFRIRDRTELEHALDEIRTKIDRVAAPFDAVLAHAELPPEIRGVGGRHCLAEGILSGRQCTLEGYVLHGRVVVYGVVDSIRYANETSFARYQYPSRLPRSVQAHMIECATKVLQKIGLERSCFNMEFFYDEVCDRVQLLEINPRISQSHCVLFEHVHGASHQEIMIDVALGREPRYPPAGAGPYPIAAKFMHREAHDGVVTHVPSEARLREIEAQIPGTVVQLNVSEGTRLAHLEEQDSYMFQIAEIHTGARDVDELLDKYEACRSAMGIVVERVDGESRLPLQPGMGTAASR